MPFSPRHRRPPSAACSHLQPGNLHADACRCPRARAHGLLTILRETLIKISATVVSHGRYVTFQMAEVEVPYQMFQESYR